MQHLASVAEVPEDVKQHDAVHATAHSDEHVGPFRQQVVAPDEAVHFIAHHRGR
jgi:hypothetical protein